ATPRPPRRSGSWQRWSPGLHRHGRSPATEGPREERRRDERRADDHDEDGAEQLAREHARAEPDVREDEPHLTPGRHADADRPAIEPAPRHPHPAASFPRTAIASSAPPTASTPALR